MQDKHTKVSDSTIHSNILNLKNPSKDAINKVKRMYTEQKIFPHINMTRVISGLF
jgi:hypothetical protein